MKPMLDAQRSDDINKIAQYEDIRPLNIEDYLAAKTGGALSDYDFLSKYGALSLEAPA